MSAIVTGDAEILLEFDQVSVSYAGKSSLFRPARKVRAVNAVSFQLKQGEVLGIVGESGSGKSTMAKLAMRMLKPEQGEIRYRGKALADYRGRDENCLRKEIQMVFQDPNASLNPRLTIEQSLREPFYLHDLGSSIEQHEEITRLLKLVGLPVSVLHRYPHELSGGQKQRVVIARALALQPKVLIADEAVAALDASVKAQIINLLLSLREQLGLTIIFISHDLPLVQIMCDRVLVLYLGQKMELASRTAIASGGAHPYTRALWASSPVADPSRRLQREQLLQGEIPSPLAPPSGCVFHTRCPQAAAICREKPVSPPALSDAHQVICHFTQGNSV